MKYWIITLAILSGCGAVPIGPPVVFSTGEADISLVNDITLIDRAVRFSGLRSTIYYGRSWEDERQALITELRERHPDWRWNDIMTGRISVGMSEFEARLSWGYPTDINRASYGDQWIYRRGNYSAQYLYFENGVLTSFNES